MKRVYINLAVALLTSIMAIAASSFLKFIKPTTITQEAVIVHFEWVGKYSAYSPVELSNDQYMFGGRLRIVSEEVHMKSERLRYDINVRYPQIVGTNDPHVRELNRRIRSLVQPEYEWPLDPSEEELKENLEDYPSSINSVDLDYEVFTASDSLISIYINVRSFGIGAANTSQTSHAINYDLKLRRELQLSDILRRDSNYLDFISRYCATELLKKAKHVKAVTPRSYFTGWNVTREGVRINFDRCMVLSCADGEQSVEIPFTDLKPFWNSSFRL